MCYRFALNLPNLRYFSQLFHVYIFTNQKQLLIIKRNKTKPLTVRSKLELELNRINTNNLNKKLCFQYCTINYFSSLTLPRFISILN